ncbi:MAG: hypothetical protein ACJ71T_12765 [Actinomycetales bacterium]
MLPDGPWPTSDVAPLDPMLVAEALADLAAGQAEMQDAITRLAQGSDGEPHQGYWTWRFLDDKAASALLDELREWVDWLIERYELFDDRHAIEPCWAEHTVAVEELTALMIAWKAEFGSTARRASAGPIAWHANWLWSTLQRVHDSPSIRGCRRTNRH